MIDPVFLHIGGLQIRYYGLIYTVMFIIGTIMIMKISEYKRNKLKEKEYEKFDKDTIIDYMIFLIIGSILTARIFHIVFYNLGYYLANPFEILAFWHGGMSFHGGLVGGILATMLFCRLRKIDFYTVADVVMIPVAIGLAIGRIGNFINQELYGKITTVPWAVKFDGVEGLRHPTQLYESAKNFVIFGTLLFMNSKKQKKGTIFWTFVAMYGYLRFGIEFFKDFPVVFMGMTMGQLLCLPMMIAGTVMLIGINRNPEKRLKSRK